MAAQDTETYVLRNTLIACHGMEARFFLRDMSEMKRTRLIEARKRAKLKQPDIAESMGVSVPQVSRWETGKDGIPSQRLAALSKAYRAKISELFDEDEIPSLASFRSGFTDNAARTVLAFVANRFTNARIETDHPMVAELSPILRSYVEFAENASPHEKIETFNAWLSGVSATLHR